MGDGGGDHHSEHACMCGCVRCECTWCVCVGGMWVGGGRVGGWVGVGGRVWAWVIECGWASVGVGD